MCALYVIHCSSVIALRFEELFYSVSRTMCPIDTTDLEDDNSLSSFLLYLDVFTTSLNEVKHQIQVDIVQQFVIE